MGALHCDSKVASFVDQAESLDDGPPKVVLVFATPIVPESTDGAFRYVICGDTWDWSHWPARIDSKAIVRHIWQHHRISVPIVPVKRHVLDEIHRCHRFPGEFFPFAPAGYERLEDFSITREESPLARSPDEAELVARHLAECLDPA